MEKRAAAGNTDVDMDSDACAQFFKPEFFNWADEVAASDTDGEGSVVVVDEKVRLSPFSPVATY